MYLHPMLCITPDRIPLGISDAWMWSRGESKALSTPADWLVRARHNRKLSTE